MSVLGKWSISVREGKIEIINVLDLKTEINATYSGFVYTPLMLCALCIHGDEQVVEKLLLNGADVNATNMFSETALMLAVRSNNYLVA